MFVCLLVFLKAFKLFFDVCKKVSGTCPQLNPSMTQCSIPSLKLWPLFLFNCFSNCYIALTANMDLWTQKWWVYTLYYFSPAWHAGLSMEFNNRKKYICVSWSPHAKKVLSLKLMAHLSILVWSLDVLPVLVWVSSGCYSFLTQVKNMQIRHLATLIHS